MLAATVYSHHKFGHAFEGAPPPHVSYIVCSMPRSGSSLLCDVLAGTELAGAPTEYFDRNQMEAFQREWDAPAFDDYLSTVLSKKTSLNGVFGVKAHFHQLRDALGARGFGGLDDLFPDLHLIYIARRDHVRQAVSWARAIQTGQWASDHPVRGGEPRFDPAQLRDLLGRIEQEERDWQGFFESRGAEPLRIDYEELTGAVNQTVLRVLAFVGVAVPDGFEPPPPTIDRQADELSDEWVRRYRALA
jgi:LPS sulfotransferase NodH